MTTESRKIQLETEVDATGARKGFEEVKQGARDMAQAVGQAGAQASKGMDGIGAGAQDGAQGIDRATRSIIGSIERATAALKAGGKAGSEYYELLARQRGVSVDTLRPYLDQLKQAELAQQAASGSLGKMEVSANQTAAALRGVPAQFTDIITSLQGGQAPLTVFLQQGGQLKDMFGGAGNAARALSGYVLGLVNPMTVAAAVAGTLAVAYNQGSKEADGYRRAIVLTGNAAGTTTGQLTEYARAIDAVVGTQGKAAETIAAFVSTGRVQSQMLEQFSTAAIRFERTTSQAVGETAKQFADLRNAPLEATLKLNEGMNYLTRSTYNQIKALEEQGLITEAAAVAQSTYADALTSRAGEIEANLGSIERGWLAVKDAAKEAWDAILNVGRRGTQADALAGLESNLARVQRELAGAGFSETAGGAVVGRPMDGRRRAQLQAEEMALQEQVKLLRQSITLSEERAAAEARAAEQIRARAAWDKEGLKYLDDRARLEREINAERERGLAAGASQAEIEARIAAIRERAAKKGPSSRPGDEFAADRAAAKEWAQFYERFADLAADAAGKVAQLSKAQIELVKFLQSPAYQNMDEPARQLVLQKAYAAVEEERLQAAQKESVRIAAEAARAYGQWIDALEKSADAAAKQVQSLTVENQAAAIAAEGYYSLAQAVQLVEIARLEERQAAMLGNEDAVLAIQREIDKRRELVGLIGAKDAREAAADAAKKAEQEAVRSLKSIDDAGREAFLAIGREGVDAFERIGDSLKASVLDVLYQLTLRPFIIQVAAQVTGAPQSAVQQLVGGGGGGGLGGLPAIPGLGSGIAGAFGNFGAGFGVGSAGGLFGGGLSTGVSLMQSGATIGGLGAIAGAVMPWISAIGAIASLFGNRNKWSGRFGEASVFGGVASAGGNSAFSNSSYSSEIAKGTSQLAQGISDLARTFGGGGDFVLRQFSATASKKDAAQAGTDLFVGGQFFSTGSTEVKKDQQAQEFANQALRATVLVLQETVQGRFGEYFRSVDALKADVPDLQALVDTANAVQQLGKQLEWLGGPFDDLANLSVSATNSMAKSAGGFDQLLSITSTAYQVLYTEEERLALLREDVAAGFAKLGVSMPETTQQLRQYIEGIDTSTEAGRSLLVELLKLAPALDQVAEKVTDVVGAALTDAQQQAVRAGYSINPEVAAVQAQQRADDAIREAARIQREREKQWEAWLGIKDPGRKTPAADGMGLAINLAGAYQAQIDAMTSQRSEIEKSVDAYRALNESLMSFKTSLLLGASSTLTPQQQYEMAKAQFDSVSAQALAGDVAAQEQLKDVVSAFVEESRSYFGANDAYAADFERSTGVIDQVVAQRQAAEDRQVALLEAVEQRLAEIEKRIGQSLDIQEAGFTESVKATRSVVDAQSAAALRARSENA